MTDHDWIQIEQAAKGCVSGTLDEWPHLKGALRRCGVHLPKETTATALRIVCGQIVRTTKREITEQV